MQTVIATAIVGETGNVQHLILHHPHYQTRVPVWAFDAPHLGDYDSGEVFRRALGEYLITQTIKMLKLTGCCHGERLVYVNEACTVYVYEIDFDS